MLAPFLIAALAATSPVSCEPAVSATVVVAVDSQLAALYDKGTTFDAFLAAADDRKAQWERHFAEQVVPADVLATAKALRGSWRLLVVAVDSCSDSVNTIPILARLVAEVPAIGMRIITPEQGRAQMEGHRTPDGRAATPTVILLDATGKEVGCWVERPAALQAMAVAAREKGEIETFGREKQAWYDRDAGASTVREVVAALAAAESGSQRCDAKR